MPTLSSHNLFKALYSRDDSKIQSPFVCNSALNLDDTSFDISNTQGVITDSNGKTLSSINLESIHAAGITQYNTETRIIQPNSYFVLQGQEFGYAYTTYYFILPEITKEYTQWEEFMELDMDIVYDMNLHYTLHINILPKENETIIDKLNEFFSNNDIQVVVSLQTEHIKSEGKDIEYIVLQAQSEGYFFFIKNFKLKPILVSTDYPYSPFSLYVDNPNDLVYKLIKEYKPINKDEVVYTTPNISLYEWLLTNMYTLSEQIEVLMDYLQTLNRAEELLRTNSDIQFTDIEINNILENNKQALAIIKDTVYDSEIFLNYNIENRFIISNIIEQLNKEIYTASLRLNKIYWLDEVQEKRIPVMKYPNGAFRGIVIIPDFPAMDDFEYSTLYINHIQDYVNLPIPCTSEPNLFYLEKFGVQSNVLLNCERKAGQPTIQGNIQLKTTIMDGWDNPSGNDSNNLDFSIDYNDPYNSDCINPSHNREFDQHSHSCDEVIYLGESCYSDKTHIIDIARYGNYVHDNNMWLRVGEGYIAIGKDDNSQNFTKNLLNSVLIYNPNNIPVKFQYMIFS